MRLPQWLAEGKLRRHETSPKEVEDILKLAARDLADAAVPQLSPDRKFATAYNAALALATIALHAAGYRTAGPGAHWITFQALPEVMGAEAQARADYFDGCRTKRNITDYDRAGEISQGEAAEILEEARAFRTELLTWLAANYPELIS